LEVQHALLLEGLSRRFTRVLRADPLRLRLDFSDTRLARRHLAWLALPSWTDRVEALTLYNWPAPASEERSRNFLDPSLCTHSDVVSPLLAVLRIFQRASLRQLLGMPLRQDGVPIPIPVPDNSDEDSDSDVSEPLWTSACSASNSWVYQVDWATVSCTATCRRRWLLCCTEDHTHAA